MKKLILIFLMVSFSYKAQPLFQRVPDNIKHHYTAVIITDITAGLTYKFSKGKIGLSILTGLFTGIGVTLLKEELWDRALGKGVPNIEDKLNGFMGSGCGTIYWIVYMVPKHDRRVDLDNNFLDLQDSTNKLIIKDEHR